MINVEHEDPIIRAYILFGQTSMVAQKYTDACFYKETGLSGIKFIVLQTLARNKRTMMPSQIAQWTYRERHDITTLVDRMSREGLVVAKRSSKDRRSVNITLTDKGREVLNQARPVAREITNQMMSSISEGDALQLEKLLVVLRQNAHYGLERVYEHSRPQPE